MKWKKAASWLLALAWMVSLCPLPSWALETEVTIQTGAGTQAQFPLVWEDSWFFQEPGQYQQGMAQAAMTLSATAYSQNQGLEIKQALESLGFQQVRRYHYDQPGQEDGENSVAFALGCKKLEGTGKTLVAMVFQGTQGSNQWQSNFAVGDGLLHQGFSLASQDALAALEEYRTQQGLEHPLFFLTGHSRGGAAANLTAARLWEGGEQVYCYTFATPATVQTQAVTEEYPIFNILSPQDPVPRLPLAAWGYGRYGQDLFLPSQSTRQDYDTLASRMVSAYRALTGGDPPNGSCLETDRLIAALEDLAPTLADYTDKTFQLGSSSSRQVTLEEYFSTLSPLLGGDGDQTQATFFFLTSLQGELAPLSRALQDAIQGAGLFASHNMACYLSWLSLGEEALDTQCAYLRLYSEGALSPRFQEDGEESYFFDLPLGQNLSLTAQEKESLKVERYQRGSRADSLFYVLPAGETLLTAAWEPFLTGPEGTLSPAPAFSDVPEGAWYYEDVSWCAAQSLLEGDSQAFFPQGEVNRAMAVTVLYRLAGSPPASSSSFPDVEEEAWYAAPCAWAKSQGIAFGDEEELFHPQAPVSRQEMAVFFCRFAQGESRDDSLDAFSDLDQVSPWARNALSWAVEQGLMEGTSSHQLSPQSTLTRSQLAALSARLERMGDLE